MDSYTYMSPPKPKIDAGALKERRAWSEYMFSLSSAESPSSEAASGASLSPM